MSESIWSPFYQQRIKLVDNGDGTFCPQFCSPNNAAQSQNISSAETNTLSQTSGSLERIVVNRAIVSGVVTIYDSITASGVVIATITLPPLLQLSQFTLEYSLKFLNGLTVVTTNNTDITVVYNEF